MVDIFHLLRYPPDIRQGINSPAYSESPLKRTGGKLQSISIDIWDDFQACCCQLAIFSPEMNFWAGFN
ncbi:MAG: hypothetical protein KME08_04100 [Aphanothece sp. CMT-3BRIN-NPC111]|nr:hypothetical protein [Aphanothece sp. CMT-3BRIN-NPC111]